MFKKEQGLKTATAPTTFSGCGLSLGQVNEACSETRPVFDIAQPKIEETAHQALEKE